VKFAKKSNLDLQVNEEQYARNLDDDIKQLAILTQGRIRFGTGADGVNGENMAGQFQVYTSNGSADTEDTIAHTLGSVPIGYIVIKQDKGSVVYDSGTAWTATNVYLKQTVATVATTIFLIK
jgi:hypothetical protein